MPTTVREYLYAFLISATAVLLIAGVVVFWAALSLQTYAIAAAILGVAALTFVGARYLKPERAGEDIQALSDYMAGNKAVDEKRPSGN